MRVVHVQRRADIEAVRTGLPITGMEQEVMEAVLHNDVVVLCGETGCGKTTQVSAAKNVSSHDCRHDRCTVVLVEWIALSSNGLGEKSS